MKSSSYITVADEQPILTSVGKIVVLLIVLLTATQNVVRVYLGREFIVGTIIAILIGALLIVCAAFRKKAQLLLAIDVFVSFYLLIYVARLILDGLHPHLLLATAYDTRFFLCYFIARHVGTSSEEIEEIHKGVAIILSIVAGAGIIQHLLWSEQEILPLLQRINSTDSLIGNYYGGRVFRASPLFLSYLDAGLSLSITVILWISLTRKWRRGIMTALVATIYCVLLTGTRTAVGAMLAGIAVYIGVKSRRSLLMGSTAFMISSIIVFIVDSVYPITFLRHAIQGLTFQEGSANYRLGNWIQAWEGMTFFGNGIGTAGLASFEHAKAFIPENYYLLVGYQLGFIGMATYLILNFGIIVTAYYISRSNVPLIRNQGQRLLAVSIFLLLSQLLLPVMTFSLTSTVAWIIIGLTIRSYLLSRKSAHIVTA
jgi:hypothetical protein